jgi:hypothetical protein
MTPDEHRETFTGALYEWLELHGVAFEPITAGPPFMARLDLVQLKVGMVALIEAFGGSFEPTQPTDMHEVMALLLAALPPGTSADRCRQGVGMTESFRVSERAMVATWRAKGNGKNGPVISVRPDPRVWAEALKLAGGDPKRIRMVAENGGVSCVVLNEPGAALPQDPRVAAAERWNAEQEVITARWCAIRERLIALDIPVPSYHVAHLALASWEKLLSLAEQAK